MKNKRPWLYNLSSLLDDNKVHIKSATEIMTIQFPEIPWIIPGLISEGLTMLCGAPKIGKSWFVLNLALAAITGGGFLGTLKANKTDTLYIALEDTERRIQKRLKKLKAENVDNLYVATQWKDGYNGLKNYLNANKRIGLVIIDTLARFTNIEDFNAYAGTTNTMTPLKKIADDLNIAVIVIHHARKTRSDTGDTDWMESALGSTGFTGAADNIIYIKRNRSKEKTTARLYATGRDITDIEYCLKMDNDCGWVISEKTQTQPNSDIWEEYTDDNGTKRRRKKP